MATQLTLDFTIKPIVEDGPTIRTGDWLDVTDIARGVGFTDKVDVRIALDDALRPRASEADAEYDQHLYDCLWLAHFRMSLDHLPSTRFHFVFQLKDRHTAKTSEVNLTVRAERAKEAVVLGLSQDF